MQKFNLTLLMCFLMFRSQLRCFLPHTVCKVLIHKDHGAFEFFPPCPYIWEDSLWWKVACYFAPQIFPCDKHIPFQLTWDQVLIYQPGVVWPLLLWLAMIHSFLQWLHRQWCCFSDTQVLHNVYQRMATQMQTGLRCPSDCMVTKSFVQVLGICFLCPVHLS